MLNDVPFAPSPDEKREEKKTETENARSL